MITIKKLLTLMDGDEMVWYVVSFVDVNLFRIKKNEIQEHNSANRRH